MNTSPATDRIYDTLAGEILRFEHKPGDLLSENLLCQRFSLSRTPIRSILQRLQENGLVRIVPQRGSIVTRLDLFAVCQLLYGRLAVESAVLRDFIGICTPEQEALVRDALCRMHDAARPFFADTAHFDAAPFLHADHDMHTIWFDACRKPYLWQRLSGVHSSYTRFSMLDVISGANVADVLEDHEQMLSLIASHNPDGVQELMYRHLYGGLRRLAGKITTEYAGYFEPIDEDELRAALP